MIEDRFVELMKPLVLGQTDKHLYNGKGAGHWHKDDAHDQFYAASERVQTIPAFRALALWQYQEVSTQLCTIAASTDEVRVHYASPTRFKMIEGRCLALLTGDINRHYKRRDIVDYAGQFSFASPATVRKFLREDPLVSLLGVDTPGNGVRIVPSAKWMVGHVTKQLVTLLYRYAFYRYPGVEDDVAAATFYHRWVRGFGFDSEVLDYAEKVFSLDDVFNQNADAINHGDD